MKKGAFAGFFLAALLAAAIFRLAGLGLRPMHHDEANQALKFGALLEQGEYRYDKADHHGPSLYYFTLPFVWPSSTNALSGLSEASLRTVTAAFGVGTILLLLLLIPLLGRRAIAAAAVCLAVSPVMVYFSRFYIQESLLVFFLVGFLASVWRYLRQPGGKWAVTAGVFAGLMYATKETAAIAFGAAAVSLLLTFLIADESRKRKLPWSHVLIAFVVAIVVSFLLFSSFFQNPRGFWDSILSFRVYFVRAGEGGFHVHPWYYYFQTLAFTQPKTGPLWSEGLVLILALIGCIAAFKTRPAATAPARFSIFLVFYSALTAAAFSLIPYKTPWNALPFYIGFVLLAGVGFSTMIDLFRAPFCRLAIGLLIAAAFVHLGIQTYRANFVYAADPRNPYVYAQTTPDFLKLVRRVEDIASRRPEGRNLLIKVIAGPYETWPLPWYLRAFGRVGYWTSAEQASEIDRPPLIITSAEEAVKLEADLNTIYRSEFYGLRPGVLLALHVRDDIWDSVFDRRQE